MEQINKVAVIGGSGKSGRFLVMELLRRNFHIRALVRQPGRIDSVHPSIESIIGDARDYHAIHTLVKGCQSVISTLGQPKDEAPIFSDATKNIIQAMTETGIKRYIVTTGLSVNVPGDRKTIPSQLATEWMYEHYPTTTHDKQLEYTLLAQSELEWTLVRLPLIKLTEETTEMRILLRDCPGSQISSANLAAFLVNQIESMDYIHRAPFISN